LSIFDTVTRLFRAPEKPEDVLSSTRTREIFTQARQNPLQAYFNRLHNPDPTLARFAGGEGFGLYYRIRRQITSIGGLVGQLVDGVMKRRPVVIAGDLSSEESVRVADDVRQIWDDIPRKAVALRKSVDTLVTCGFAPIELVWGRDVRTGIVAPVGAMRPDGTRGPGLIDRPAANFTFALDGSPKFLSVVDPIIGEAIEPLKFVFLQAGSLNTPWGESEFSDVYSAAWLYQQVQQMAVDAVEKYGRPTPHVLIPRGTTPEGVAEIDSFYTKKFGDYTRGFYDGDKVTVEYPAMPVAQAGMAGRSETELLRYFQTQIYIRLLRTPQTQDRTGGSRALEMTRAAITDLATLTYGDILCEGLQDGWMRPVCEINFPSLDPALRPRFVPDPSGSETLDSLHLRLMAGIDRGIAYSKQWYFRRLGAQEARDPDDVLGHPATTIRATLQDVPPPEPDPNSEDAQDTQNSPDDPARQEGQPQ